MPLRYELDAVCPDTGARAGRLHTDHGTIETPMFMPVGTVGTVKALAPRTLHELGTNILLGNTYHLALRPGREVLRQLGGLHPFMSWDGPILTDSGGLSGVLAGPAPHDVRGGRHVSEPPQRCHAHVHARERGGHAA